MQIQLSRFPTEVERPEPLKFAWPILLLPELFASVRHLRILTGFLVTIGWEVYVPDLRAAAGRDATPELAHLSFAHLLELAGEAITAIGQPAVVMGHGLGGLLALKLAERAQIKAAVALAPSIPGLRNPLISWRENLRARWSAGPLRPPGGRVVQQLLADADAFHQAALSQALIADSITAPADVEQGKVTLATGPGIAPRLIVAGERDTLVPAAQLQTFAASVGATLKTVAGRGHWLIGGRAVERAVGEAHRFLVRALGQDLLLLYPEEWKDEPD